MKYDRAIFTDMLTIGKDAALGIVLAFIFFTRQESFLLDVLRRIRRDPSGSVQNLSHIWSGDGFGLRDLRLIERPHVHVALG